jgi:hypothetical protein
MTSPQRFLAVAAALGALAFAHAGVARADYDAGHWASGIMVCGSRNADGSYPMATTGPVMVPDVASQWLAFRDELWNDAGGRWHMVLQSPWLYKHAPSDIFSAGLQDAFTTYSWQTSAGVRTSGVRRYNVRPGSANWAIRQTLYWYPQQYTIYGSQTGDIFTQGSTTTTATAPAHTRYTWANQSAMGGGDSSYCNLRNGRFA